MSRKYQLMIDPTPAGYLYGFPKPLPEHAVAGSGYDLFILNSFDLAKWVVEQGYPEESFRYYRTWPEEVKEDKYLGEDSGIEDFSTNYYYPGSDCQE